MKKNKTEFLPCMLNKEAFHMDLRYKCEDKTKKLVKENVGKTSTVKQW